MKELSEDYDDIMSHGVCFCDHVICITLRKMFVCGTFGVSGLYIEDGGSVIVLSALAEV